MLASVAAAYLPVQEHASKHAPPCPLGRHWLAHVLQGNHQPLPGLQTAEDGLPADSASSELDYISPAEHPGALHSLWALKRLCLSCRVLSSDPDSACVWAGSDKGSVKQLLLKSSKTDSGALVFTLETTAVLRPSPAQSSSEPLSILPSGKNSRASECSCRPRSSLMD